MLGVMQGKHNLFDMIMKNIIISPANAGFYYWEITVLITSIVSSMMYAMWAAFRYDVDYEGYVEYYTQVNFATNHMNKFTVQEIRHYNKIQIAFELYFLIEMMLGFITEYYDHNNKPVRDFYKISERYLRGGFIYDIIPLIPFNFLIHFESSRILFLLKTARLI